MKNAIFGLKKGQDFWTEIILFSTFQVSVHHQTGNGKGQDLFELFLVKFAGTMPMIMIIMEALLVTPVKHFFAGKLL